MSGRRDVLHGNGLLGTLDIPGKDGKHGTEKKEKEITVRQIQN